MGDDWASRANPTDLGALAHAPEDGRVSPQGDALAIAGAPAQCFDRHQFLRQSTSSSIPAS